MAIEWLTGQADVRCCVCGREHGQALIAAVDVAWRDAPVEIARCAGCGAIALGATEQQRPLTDDQIDWYVECGASLDAIATTLAQVRRPPGARFLDVGCGYGFGLDLARSVHGWDGVGVDPSRAAERGRVELGIDIRTVALEDTGLDDGSFDVVLASEVLEHVADPGLFLGEIRRLLAHDGILVLTTPDGAVVHPAESPPTLLAALSVGAHHFLVDAEGLQRLLQRAGFYCNLRHDGAALRVVASPSKRALRRAAGVPAADLHTLQRYCGTLADTAPPASALAVGTAVRHLKYAVHCGDYDAAAAGLSRVRDAIRARYSIDLEDAAATVATTGRASPPGVVVGAHYFAGMLQLVRGDAHLAAQHFAASAATAEAQLALGATHCDPETASLELSALGHEAIARARFDPHAVPGLLERLGNRITPGNGQEALTAAQLRGRAFTELVAHGALDGALDVAARLAPEVAGLRPLTDGANAYDRDAALVSMGTMFALGILALHRGRPAEAAAWFGLCARLTAGSTDQDLRDLQHHAQSHEQLALTSLGTGVALPFGEAGARGDFSGQVELDTYWCDPSGVFVAGRANGDGGGELVAFEHYQSGRPGRAITVPLDDLGQKTRIEVVLPDHPLPQWPKDGLDDGGVEHMLSRIADLAPLGPVLYLGGRSDIERADHFRSVLAPRPVFVIDVHPGSDVDVVGDVHSLSRFLRAESAAAVISLSLLEHVAAPWAVAQEVNRVLAPDGLTLQAAPTVWPEHAAPNDFWRFSMAGLEELFGTAFGFEVLESVAGCPVMIVPAPQHRVVHARMPTMISPALAAVLARKSRTTVGSMRSRDASDDARTARRYPPEALTPVSDRRKDLNAL